VKKASLRLPVDLESTFFCPFFEVKKKLLLSKLEVRQMFFALL